MSFRKGRMVFPLSPNSDSHCLSNEASRLRRPCTTVSSDGIRVPEYRRSTNYRLLFSRTCTDRPPPNSRCGLFVGLLRSDLNTVPFTVISELMYALNMITTTIETTLLTKRRYRIHKDYPLDGYIGMSSCRHGR